jgi:hypothetical protein
MIETLASLLVGAIATYLVVGLFIAIPFVSRRVKNSDPAANDSGLGFRLLILPGAVALWPLVLAWRKRSTPGEENNAHRRAAREATS